MAPNLPTPKRTAKQAEEENHRRDIMQRIGYLLEGLNVPEPVDGETVRRLRHRFNLRRNLANLARVPEGYQFVWEVNGKSHDVILLTPPNQVAVQRANGTWYRRLRVDGDGPAPYTVDWYNSWLRENDLPSFFLTQAHLTMLTDPVESQSLGLDNNLPALAEPPAIDYLQRKYPEPVQHLLPGGDSKIYTVVLDHALIQRLVRRFPFVLANAITFKDYRVYVLPNGYIEIRGLHQHATSTEREVEQAQLSWLPEPYGTYLGSYMLENERQFVPPAPTTRDRTQDRQNVQNDGGLVDLNERPAGIGRLEWFDPAVDAVRARNLGLDSPDDVLQARAIGTLTNVPVNQRPWTVWWPDNRFLNPATQPQGAGQWEYYTTDSEQLAWTNLGGQAAFPDEQRPTALDIYNRRVFVRLTGITDDTQGIDIVWVPVVPPGPAGPPPPRPPPRTSSANAKTSNILDTSDIIDADSGLTHQPNNSGGSNQTGVQGERKYQTIKIKGKLFTIDRSRAHAETVQEWKSWSVNKNGKWYQWPHYAKLDWKTPFEVEKMNKWREQSLTRAGFPRKRKDDRADYSQAERDWTFEHVKANNGERPAEMSMAELTRRFNAHFGGNRLELGVQSLYDRLRTEFKDNNGQQRLHKPRGAARRISQQETGSNDDDEESNGGYDSQSDEEE